MAGADAIHGARDDTSPALLPEHHGSLGAGDAPASSASFSPPSPADQPLSFLAIYRPQARGVRIYPIGADLPFDGPIDLSEAQAQALMAELRRAIDVPACAAELVRGER